MKNYGQIIRTIIYVFTMLNTILTATGHNPLPISDSEIYIWVTLALTVAVFAYGVWKNYPTSEAGRVADKVLHAVKSGAAQAQDVLNLLEYGATGGYKSALPFTGRNRVTQPYTYKTASKTGHGGIDIVGDDDTTVHAVESGTVTMISKWDGKTKTGTQSYGNLVVVTDNDNCRHYYAHLQSIAVSKGQFVFVGTKIGVMGNTGNSFGAHLHYEVRTGQTTATRVNPADYCGVENAKGTYTEQSNGAQTAEPVVGTYYPREDLNVRTGAGVGYTIAEKNGAKYNIAYPVYEIKRVGTQNWGRIGTTRWICLAYCATTPVTTANSTQNTENGLTAYVLTCDMLKVRKSPSTLSKQVSTYTRGEVFYVRKWQGNWAQLKSGNWMCAKKYCRKA